MSVEPITLASGSEIRFRILTNAGVKAVRERPNVDEAAIKVEMTAHGLAGESIAQALADAKTAEVAQRTPGLVLGGDQILRFDGALFDKADSLEEARRRLIELSGKTHELVGAVSLARDGVIVRRHLEVSRLRMRPLTEAVLDSYLKTAGPEILKSVGCYQYEGLGAQLFDQVEGDYFAILGLPLLPVLAMLRAEGALES